MEKASKILVFIFFLGLAYLAWSVLVYIPQQELDAKSSGLKMVVEGDSMLPTLKNGDIVHYSVSEPSVGDIVIFQCLSLKCDHSYKSALVKRLAEVHDGCYRFLGDNPENSNDSRYFGELCGDEVRIDGVITSVEGGTVTIENNPSSHQDQPTESRDQYGYYIYPESEKVVAPSIQTSPSVAPKEQPKQKVNETEIIDVDDYMFDLEMKQDLERMDKRNAQLEQSTKAIKKSKASHPGETCLFDSDGNAYSCIPSY